MLIGQRALRSLVLLVTAVVLALGSIVLTPSLASAATASVNSSVTTAQPTYTHNVVRSSDNYPCAAGSQVTHYRVFSARVVGSAATTLTATVTPSGFRANLGSYDNSFQPAAPVVNCMGDTAGSASGAPVTYSITTAPQPAGVTERTYVFVVAGYAPSDVGSFSLSVTSSTGSLVVITDVTPIPTDTTKPVLSGMNDLTREATSSAGAAVTFAPTATDAVDGSRPVTCTPASGSTFAITTTQVTCKASDTSSNQVTGTFDVTVRDTTKPVLSGMSNLTRDATSTAGAAVTFAPTATDAVDGSRPVTCAPASGSTFAIASTQVTCKASDTRGNEVTGTFEVTVGDTAKPVLAGMNNLTREATSSAGASATFAPTASDAIDGTRPVTCSPVSGSTFVLGTTTVTCKASDTRGNEATGTFTVVVSDTTKPVLSGPTTVSVEATSAAGAVVPAALTATDAVDGSLAVACSPSPSQASAIGTTTVTCSATDKSGNKGTGTYTVTVKDTTGPVFTGLSTVTEEAMGSDGKPVAYTLPTASDAVDGSRPVTCAPAPGSTFAIKTTTVTCSASDTRGNSSTATFDVVVRDTTKPVLTVPADMRTSATSAAGATVSYGWGVTDGGSGLDGSPTCVPGSGSQFPLGTTTVTCTAKDRAGNVATKSFDITVVKGTLAVTGSVSVTGDAKVGATLTATSDVATTPASSTAAGQWLRNGAPITSATASTYQLTEADLGKTISYRQTDSRGGYEDAVSTSNAVGPVDQGDIALGKPAIDGTVQVGKTLTVVPGAVSPSDAEQTYEWFSGADSIGTGTTYVVKPADLASTIRVTATATRTAYSPATKTSDVTGAVVAGTLVTTGGVTVTGSAKVGQTLTAVSTVGTTPTSTSPTGQWFRGTVPVAGATGSTFVLTNQDAGSVISYSETRTLTGYTQVVTTSPATDEVSGGVITVTDPVITGTAVVDQVLSASVSGLDPADATTVLTWFVDGVEAGSGNSYPVKPSDVGRAITVVAVTSKPFFDTDTGTSASTGDVQQARFVTGPSAAITGVLKVGQELTAEAGAASPVAASFTYQWFAGGVPVKDATGRTFVLTAAQKGKPMSVEVVAVRAGYVDSADLSDESAVVVTDLAPGLTLTPSVDALRLGQSTTLTWTSLDAISVVASGSWSGDKPSAGSQEITPSTTGTPVYVLQATNGSGTTTAQVAVPVALAPARFALTATSSVRADKKLAVKASGLAPGEQYTLRLGGKVVASGQATSAGRVKRSVRVPSSVKAGSRVLRVTGSLADRTATRTVRVVRVKKLKLVLADSSVRASDRQRVTVSRLLPGERVTVTYQGKRISPKGARANRKGVFTMTFDVDVVWGKKTVSATGATNRRSAKSTFSVVNRCPQGGYYCR